MREGRIPIDWFSRQVAQADRTDGGIDTLSTRIAHIRTWTFAANRPDWLADPEHWQGVTRTVEDRLSDALHERLTERFVDRRTSVLMRRLRENTMLETEIAKSGEVVVEGHVIGRLGGFQFMADPSAGGPEAKALRAAAQKALAGEIDTRAARLANAADDQFVLASDGTIRWVGEAVGRLTAGDDVAQPRVRILADEHLTGASRDVVQGRLDLWLTPTRKAARPAARALARRGRDRHGARTGVPAARRPRRDRAPPRGRRGEGARSGGARILAQIRRAVRRLSRLPAGAPEACAALARSAALGAQAQRRRAQGARRGAPARLERPHVVRRRQGGATGRSTARSATGCAANGRSASTSSSGSPTLFARRSRGAPAA